MVRTEPVIFSPTQPKPSLLRDQHVVADDATGGRNWKEISPDLTRKTFEVPASIGKFRDRPTAQPRQRGVIYTVAPSPLDGNRIWAGTDDGLIHLTTDGGKNWTDVTPPQIGPWWKISLMDAGHFDAKTRLRGGQHDSARRPASAHLPDARRRQDVAGNRARDPERRKRQRGARRHAATRTVVRRRRSAVFTSPSTTATTGSRFA